MNGNELHWVNAHHQELLQEHPGGWLAVRGEEVVASASSMKELAAKVRGMEREEGVFLVNLREDYSNLAPFAF